MDAMKHLRWIVIISLLAVMSLPAIPFFYVFPAVKKITVETTEKRLINIAYQLAGHFRRKAPVSESVPLPAAFIGEINRVSKIVGLYKVKVFTTQGIIVYSTKKSEIGNHTQKDFFPEVVTHGAARSLISEKQLADEYGNVGNRLVLETYVPLVSQDKILGAFEIYYDISEDMGRHQKVLSRSILLVLGLVVVLVVAILVAVDFARRSIARRRLAEERGRKLETRLLQAKKMEAVGTLVGGLVHDVNNILTSALAYIGMAERKAADNPDAIALMGDARGALKKILELLSELRGVAVTRRLHLEPVESDEFLKGVLDSFGRYPEINVRLEWESRHLPAMRIDPEEMGHVLRGIILNGIQAMDFTGTITVRCAAEALGEHNGLNLAPGRYLRLSIVDQGVGIAQADIDRIFDPYYTSKEKGSQRGVGLGLSYCYATILQHGGQLEVESKPGEGSSFHLWIPVSE